MSHRLELHRRVANFARAVQREAGGVVDVNSRRAERRYRFTVAVYEGRPSIKQPSDFGEDSLGSTTSGGCREAGEGFADQPVFCQGVVIPRLASEAAFTLGGMCGRPQWDGETPVRRWVDITARCAGNGCIWSGEKLAGLFYTQDTHRRLDQRAGEKSP